MLYCVLENKVSFTVFFLKISDTKLITLQDNLVSTTWVKLDLVILIQMREWLCHWHTENFKMFLNILCHTVLNKCSVQHSQQSQNIWQMIPYQNARNSFWHLVWSSSCLILLQYSSTRKQLLCLSDFACEEDLYFSFDCAINLHL